MTREEKVKKLTDELAEGGYQSLYYFIDKLSDEELDNNLYLDDEDEWE